MKVYGVAIAAHSFTETGLKITSNTIAVPDEGGRNIEVLADQAYTAEIEAGNPEHTFAVFPELVKRIKYAEDLSSKTVKRTEHGFARVSLLLGMDSRFRTLDAEYSAMCKIQGLRESIFYPINAVAMELTWRERVAASLKNRSFIIANEPGQTEIAQQAMATLSYFQSLGFRKVNLQQHYHDLANMLAFCRISAGNYYQKEKYFDSAEEESEYHSSMFNAREELRDLKKKLDAGSPQALASLIEVARGEAKTYKPTIRAFGIGVPYKDFAERPDLQEMCPEFCYMHWHPEIEKAFRDSYKEELGVPYNTVLILPLDKRMPFFVHPCAEIALDEIDILLGRKSRSIYEQREKDGKYKPDWQEEFMQGAAEVYDLLDR